MFLIELKYSKNYPEIKLSKVLKKVHFWSICRTLETLTLSWWSWYQVLTLEIPIRVKCVKSNKHRPTNYFLLIQSATTNLYFLHNEISEVWLYCSFQMQVLEGVDGQISCCRQTYHWLMVHDGPNMGPTRLYPSQLQFSDSINQ